MHDVLGAATLLNVQNIVYIPTKMATNPKLGWPLLPTTTSDLKHCREHFVHLYKLLCNRYGLQSMSSTLNMLEWPQVYNRGKSRNLIF